MTLLTKLKHVALLSISNFVNAAINQNNIELIFRHANSTTHSNKNSLLSNPNNPEIDGLKPRLKSIKNFSKTSLSDSYGCYCHFSATNMLYEQVRGDPVDDFDKICKQLYDNYSCMLSDLPEAVEKKEIQTMVFDQQFGYENEEGEGEKLDYMLENSGVMTGLGLDFFKKFKKFNDNNNNINNNKNLGYIPSERQCIPWEQEIPIQKILSQLRSLYRENKASIFTTDAVNSICDIFYDPKNIAEPQNTCKNIACKSEVWFILTLVVTEARYPEKINPLFMQSKGFDADRECRKMPSKMMLEMRSASQNHYKERSCCGSYPKRYPFVKSFSRSCCGEKTYNSDIFQCCDGQVKDLSFMCD